MAVTESLSTVPSAAASVQCAWPAQPLRGIRVLIATSAHDVSDSRVYAREGHSIAEMGAHVTIVGAVRHSVPQDVSVVEVRAARSRFDRFIFQPWRCLRAAWKGEFDIIHVHDAEMLAILPAARLRWPRAKFIYDVHEDFANLMLVRDWLPRLLKPAAKAATNFVEKALAHFADGIVGVTPPLTQKFQHRAAITAFNFVTETFFRRCDLCRDAAQLRRYDLIHLGTLSHARARFLCDVLRAVHRQRPHTTSLVVGCSDDIAGFLRAALPQSCTVVGPTAYHELPAMLVDAKVGIDVHPHLGAHLKVAVPVKVCEYMAAGCAVVTSSMPVLDALLRDNHAPLHAVTILQSAVASEYADALLEHLARIDTGADPGQRLREFAASTLTWDAQAKNIARLYLRLLGRGAPA